VYQGLPEKAERRSPEPKKKRKKSLSGNGEEEENGVESLDWWTKYHASVETTIKVLLTCSCQTCLILSCH